MTTCPHCEKELELHENNAIRNVETYGGSNRVLTKCCDQMVRVTRNMTFHISKTYMPQDGIDDWGNESKRTANLNKKEIEIEKKEAQLATVESQIEQLQINSVSVLKEEIRLLRE
mgnify:CR=1 FL=1|tara:strand:- start:2609 stop:2953 length:345 start_codon:yes stop_codon:yes gene_type:complete